MGQLQLFMVFMIMPLYWGVIFASHCPGVI